MFKYRGYCSSCPHLPKFSYTLTAAERLKIEKETLEGLLEGSTTLSEAKTIEDCKGLFAYNSIESKIREIDIKLKMIEIKKAGDK